MKQQIYAVKDTAAQTYGQPMFMMNNGHAHRSFSDEVNRTDASNVLNHHPEDFELYNIGAYETDTGEITPIKPTLIVRAKDVHKG